jgi:hypothetical protein
MASNIHPRDWGRAFMFVVYFVLVEIMLLMREKWDTTQIANYHFFS